MAFSYDPSFDGPENPSSGLSQSFDSSQRLTTRFPESTIYPSGSFQQSAPDYSLPFLSSLPNLPPGNTLSQDYNSTAANANTSLFAGVSNPFSTTSSSSIESSLAPSAPAFEPHFPNNFPSSQVGTMAPIRKTPFPPKPKQNGSLDKEEGEISEREASKPRNGPPQSKKPRYSPQGPYSRGQGQYSLPQKNFQQSRNRRQPFGSRSSQGAMQPVRDSDRPVGKNTFQGHNAPRRDPEPNLQASNSHETSNRGTVMSNGQNATARAVPREQREHGKAFILDMHRNNYKFLELVKEGLDPTMLRSVYEDIGIPVDEAVPNAQSVPLQISTLSTTTAADTLTSKNNIFEKQNVIVPSTKSMGTKPTMAPLNLNSQEGQTFREAPKAPIPLSKPSGAEAIPAPPSNKGQTNPLAENKSTAPIARETIKEPQSGPAADGSRPSDRSDYLARLAAAKTKKPVDNAAPKPKTTGDARPAARPIPKARPETPSKEAEGTSQASPKKHSGNYGTKNEGATKEQRESELARLRMQVLKSAKAPSASQTAVDARESPGQEEKEPTRNQEQALMKGPQTPPSKPSSEEHVNVQTHPVAPIAGNQSNDAPPVSPSGLPGLFLSSEASDPMKQTLKEHASDSVDQMTAPQSLRKDQDQTVSVGSQKEFPASVVEGSLPLQRPAASHNPSQGSFTIPSKEKVKPNLPTPEAKLPKRTFGAPRFGSSNDTCIIEASDDESSNDGTNSEHVRDEIGTSRTRRPPSSQKIPVRERSAPPDMAELSRKEEGLKAQEAQIQKMKKKIEMMEQRKKMKGLSSGSDTPMTPPNANAGVSDAIFAQENVLQKPNGATLSFKKDRSEITQHPNDEAGSTVANMQSSTTPLGSPSEVKKRRAEIESRLTSADEKFASLSKEAEAKAQELERIREIIRAEETRKKELVDELERLGVDTKDIPENALEPVRDKVVADLQYQNASENGSGQLEDSTEFTHPASDPASSTNEQPSQKPQDADGIADPAQSQAETLQDRVQERDLNDLNTDRPDGQGQQPDHGQRNLDYESQKPHKPSEQGSPSLDGGGGSQPMSVDTPVSPENDSSGNDVCQSTSESGLSHDESDKMVIDDARSMERTSLSPKEAKESSVDNNGLSKTPMSSRREEQIGHDQDISLDDADEAASDEEYEPDEPQSRLHSNELPLESSNDEDDEDEEYEPPEMPGAQDPRTSKPVADTDGLTDLSAILEGQRLPRVINEDVDGPLDGDADGPRTEQSSDPRKPSGPNAENDRFTPYESPLNLLRAYRLRSHPSLGESEAFRPTSNNHEVDQQKSLCFYELNGGTCNDQRCESQHFRDVPRLGL
ncbi:MAG: hypothetical protein M1831_000205 [Alyxoria varia]|nr:MAG: hypothetical protein M1831_000205 [Alyxoria varia]